MSQQHLGSRERQQQSGLYEQETKENVRIPRDQNPSSGSGLLLNYIAHTTDSSLSLSYDVPYKTLNDFKCLSKQWQQNQRQKQRKNLSETTWRLFWSGFTSFFFALDVRSRADVTQFKVFHILFIICLLKIFFNNIVMTVV